MSGQVKFRFDYLRGALPENLAYGHQVTLERYCGKRLRIFGRLQHGFPFQLDNGYGNAQIADAEYPNFYWRKLDAEDATKKYGGGIHYFTGAPYIYLTDSAPHLDLSLPDRFTLDILPHSQSFDPPGMITSENGLIPIPISRIVKNVREVSRYEPIFLIYWKDAIPSVIRVIEESGYKWCTLGNGLYSGADQSTFLGTLRQLIRKSSEVIFHCTVSAMAYAAFEERPILFSSERAGDSQHIPWFGYLENDFYEEAHLGLGAREKLSRKDLVEVLEGGKACLGIIYRRQMEFLRKSLLRGLQRLA